MKGGKGRAPTHENNVVLHKQSKLGFGKSKNVDTKKTVVVTAYILILSNKRNTDDTDDTDFKSCDVVHVHTIFFILLNLCHLFHLCLYCCHERENAHASALGSKGLIPARRTRECPIRYSL
jgi:hypothetical protein